jgi:hypothetical protein
MCDSDNISWTLPPRILLGRLYPICYSQSATAPNLAPTAILLLVPGYSLNDLSHLLLLSHSPPFYHCISCSKARLYPHPSSAHLTIRKRSHSEAGYNNSWRLDGARPLFFSSAYLEGQGQSTGSMLFFSSNNHHGITASVAPGRGCILSPSEGLGHISKQSPLVLVTLYPAATLFTKAQKAFNFWGNESPFTLQPTHPSRQEDRDK